MDEPKEENKPDRADPEIDDAALLYDLTFDTILSSILDKQSPLEPPEAVARAKAGELDLNLHHYTTAEGLQGIIESGVLFATSAYYLNDSGEMEYGCRMFASILETWVKDHPSDDSFGGKLLKLLFYQFSDLTQMRDILARVYVACFCEKGNLLSQWRAYGQSGGYSLGFFHLTLPEYKVDHPQFEVSLQQVIYNELTQKGLLQTLIADGLPQLSRPEFTERFESLTPRGQAAALLFFTRTWHYMAMIEIVRFKHPAFDVEQEWRLVAQPQPHFVPEKVDEDEHEIVKFRPLRGTPTPYLILKPKDKTHHMRSSDGVQRLRRNESSTLLVCFSVKMITAKSLYTVPTSRSGCEGKK